MEQGLLSATPVREPALTRELVTATRRSQEAGDDIAQVRALVHEICGARQDPIAAPG
nr:hypothetical protein [Listeria monocytogenes]